MFHLTRGAIPLGTTPEEWAGSHPHPPYGNHGNSRRFALDSLPKVLGTLGDVASFGQGLPIYVTDVERTLIGAYSLSGKSGGIANVLRGWRRARETVDGKKASRGRGAIGEAISANASGSCWTPRPVGPATGEWKRQLGRGGSIRSLASAPYSPDFSPCGESFAERAARGLGRAKGRIMTAVSSRLRWRPRSSGAWKPRGRLPRGPKAVRAVHRVGKRRPRTRTEPCHWLSKVAMPG